MSIRPFHQQLTWTILAIVCVTVPLLVPQLHPAQAWMNGLAGILIGKEWLERSPDRAARKARESSAPSE